MSLVACGGDDGDDNGNDTPPEDTTDPVISLTSPTTGDSFARETGVILINGTISDDQGLETCKVSVAYSQKSASSELKSIDDPVPFDRGPVEYSDISGKEYSFTDEDPFGFVTYDATLGEYVFTITVEDTSGNTATEDITINITE
ncbi:DUF4625 domain-containing protein [Marinilabilia rubra]|nr:DUF4625 domain-containing protein [Marinilabilia rubra]